VDLDWIDRARETDYDIRTEFDIPSDAIVVGTASVITEQKALDVLVKGIARGNEQTDRRLDLVIAGNGPHRSAIQKLIRSLEIEEHVHFAGMVDRETVYQILGGIDIYAMPSRWEGFSNAAVEALGSGNACIFSDIDPFLLPYRNVAMFHRLDDVCEFVDNLIELAEDPNLRDFYAKKGRNLVEEEYTIEQVAQQYAELYAKVLT
jgi:glycosyltransferase involved in cell wall biosynthesis